MKPSNDVEFKQRLISEALRLGFADCRITTAETLDAQEEEFLLDWLRRGFHDSMDYMAREPLTRTRPHRLLEDAKSIVCLAAHYGSEKQGDAPAHAPPGFGRIARYARGEDYHRVLEAPLKSLETWMIENGGPGATTRRFCDTSPLLERAFARRAGIGFVGKNTMLIRPGHGSWFFLAAVLTNLEIEPDHAITGTCGRCTRCIDACPTQAIVEPYWLDSRRCISNLTIERKGDFSEDESASVGDWVFGCDICQEVCPYNKAPDSASFPELEAVVFPNGLMRLSDIDEIASNRQFELAFQSSPLLRARRKGLHRNAAAVLKNQKKP